MNEGYTVYEMYRLLKALIDDGFGNKEFQIYYDSELVYTYIPKGSKIEICDDGVRFSDYDDGICHIDDLDSILGYVETYKKKEHRFVNDAGLIFDYIKPMTMSEVVQELNKQNDEINEIENEIENIKLENIRIQRKVGDLIEYLGDKYEIPKKDIKSWWNRDIEKKYWGLYKNE